jgi:hypothetical protein
MASESLYKLVNRTCWHSQVLLLINESTKSLELDLTKSENCGQSIISRPSGGGTPSVSFRDGSAASGASPWTALVGSAPLFGAPIVPRCPRRAPAPTWNGGRRASTCRQASSAACWVPRRPALPLAPRPVGRRWGVGRPRSCPLRLLGPPPRILRGGLPLAPRRWRFALGAERSRLRRSVLLVTLGLQGRLLLHAGRALQEWTYRSSPRVWGLSRWSVWWGRHPLCLYLQSWPLRSSRSS